MKKNGMLVTSAIYLLLLVVTGLVFGSIYNREKKNHASAIETQKQYYTGLITSKDSLINETIKTLDEIDKQLNMVKDKQRVISINSTNPEFSQSKKEKILQDIATINSLLEANRKKIATLNGQLQKYGIEIQGLKEKVAQLDAALQQSEIQVSDLKNTVTKKDSEISQLNVKVDEQTVVIATKEETIKEQTAELNKAFIVYGTKKELINSGILSKTGVFGLGKKDINLNDGLFTKVDITEVKSIPINSKNIELISTHPANSYKFVYDGKLITRIDIVNPADFWKSKYAIIEVK